MKRPEQFYLRNFQEIVGHKGVMNLTDKVYTHIDMKLLIDAVNGKYYPDSIKISK